MRSSGVLLSIFSLPNEFGIGGFGKEVADFAENVKDGGGHWWQILPITTIGLGNSPYSGVSAFAGNFLYIDPIRLLKKGYITEQDVNEARYNGSPHTVDYGFVYQSKRRLVQKAYENIAKDNRDLLERYLSANNDWLLDYALYMAIKDENGQEAWFDWEEKYRDHDSVAVRDFFDTHAKEVGYYVCEQYLFDEQWGECVQEIHSKNIRIIGDMPIYVSLDSSDVWANPEIFDLDKDMLPKKVAGVPPDYFCAEGQLWGNPIYNYENMKKNHFDWFVSRFERMFKLYDKVRVDHFRAFDRYWAVDYGSPNAIKGEWKKGCGEELFSILTKKFPEHDILAEDLGIIDEGVCALRDKFGFPGMRVMQFALDSDDSVHLPHNYVRNCVAYTGTHDNDTTYGWLTHLRPEQMAKLQDYIGEYGELYGGENNKYVWASIRILFMSVADTVIIPFQDLVGWGSDTRTNTPGVAENNWRVRVTREAISNVRYDTLRRYNYITDRLVEETID